MIGGIGKYPYFGLAGLPLPFLLLLVTRIGNYKYSTANRNYAYELHLSRSLLYHSLSSPGNTNRILHIGWEEAMFAWRIVQATLFNALYERTWFTNRYRERRGAITKIKYRWWDTDALKGQVAKHHPGSYLRYMQIFLHNLALAAFLPAIYTAYFYIELMQSRPSEIPDAFPYVFVATLVIAIGVLLHVLKQIRRDCATRLILETGLLSIQSSAVVWRCAVVAHFRALHVKQSFQGYTNELAKQAVDLANNIEGIHKWLEHSDYFPNVTFLELKPLGEALKVRGTN